MTETGATADVVFLWHHHQPDYRSPRDGRSLLPWVRLHASKDYLDMALRLRRHPRVRATFNFVPSLLDQLDQVAAGAPDTLFDLLAKEPGALDPNERSEILRRCTVAPRYAFERWPDFRRLCERARAQGVGNGRRGGPGPLTNAELAALEAYFLLAWVDPMFHDAAEATAALAVAPHLGSPERLGLLALHLRLASEVVPAYRALAESGQVELTESPYYHPILPLLVNLEAARRARPDVTLPNEKFQAPEDAEAQVTRALERHARAFGQRPQGMWPPEGSVSPEAAEIVARAGIRWIASDEGVLWASFAGDIMPRGALYHPWRFETKAGALTLFFRDHELSDRIGFVYQHWNAQDAVADFLGRVRRIAREHAGAAAPVIVIALDGENCWEHYADDGGPFLDALYSGLDEAKDIRTCTPSQILAEREGAFPTLERLHSGSWIQADFRIWVGHPEKNRAWELLSRARGALVSERRTQETYPKAWEALYAAEGSDWFWWFGEDHFTPDKPLFDRLFREHLQGVYERAGLPLPGWIEVPITKAVERRAAHSAPLGFIHPHLDGRRTGFYEWHDAGHHALGAGGGSMHHGGGHGRDLYHGFDLEHLYLRVDFLAGSRPGADYDLRIEILTPRPMRLIVRGLGAGDRAVARQLEAGGEAPVAGGRAVLGAIVEIALPFESLGLAAGENVEILLHLVHDGRVVETLPGDDVVRFTIPDASFESAMWSA